MRSSDHDEHSDPPRGRFRLGSPAHKGGATWALHGGGGERDSKTALAHASTAPGSFAEEIHARFAAVVGFEMPEIPREPIRKNSKTAQFQMTVTDTNLLSQLTNASPSRRIMAFWDSRPRTELFVAAVTQAEILLGIALLPAGRSRTGLEAAVRETFKVSFAGRVLPFDSAAAREFAEIAVRRRKLGGPISHADCQIAAIARAHGAAVATRNSADFEHCGISIVNPWD